MRNKKLKKKTNTVVIAVFQVYDQVLAYFGKFLPNYVLVDPELIYSFCI